ncbi:MAG: helix-hairpin-helix domain-containing protein [Synechococcaceae cyanobacterium]|nr:helix-hairpin-helix domain-containing protein [Synechococcaceae cyanobacterium]
MHPRRCSRERLGTLTDLPNIGPAMARALESLGCLRPADLIGRDPLELYRSLCRQRGARQDPCVLDVFLSIEHFLAGGDARPWWEFTAERRRRHPDL